MEQKEMNTKEFEHLKSQDWEHAMADLGIISRFGADGTTLYMRDVAKKLTSTQIEEIAELLMGGVRERMDRPIIMDFTTPPPY